MMLTSCHQARLLLTVDGESTNYLQINTSHPVRRILKESKPLQKGKRNYVTLHDHGTRQVVHLTPFRDVIWAALEQTVQNRISIMSNERKPGRTHVLSYVRG